ncbi:GNAT family N-acetyltransferase [Nocardiopsis prasina]|uniref:GNAT family N-acetyltransferase n=1 Tax=Nocardiopsis prasina TaxID=2015 RepID=UPI00034C2035|nr:GNAT family N-acetyltransferase [Nocardiopsis prasina]
MQIQVRCPVDDGELSRLHADAFGHEPFLVPWSERLERHSRSWVGAFDEGKLVGFVHAVWDGGAHAFLLDTVVASGHQRRGVGGRVVAALISDLRGLGIEWLHVDYEPQLEGFYEACGFRHTRAGLLRVSG